VRLDYFRFDPKPEDPGASPSSAHTYRLLVFKEHSQEPAPKPSVAFEVQPLNYRRHPFRSASLHQQQRNEIMNNVSLFVNRFFSLPNPLTSPHRPVPQGFAARVPHSLPASFATHRAAKERNSSAHPRVAQALFQRIFISAPPL
jgi:hypothetical protein